MADDDIDEENEEGQEVQEGQEKSKKKLLIIVVAVVVLLVGGGVGTFFLMSDNGSGNEVAAKDEPSESGSDNESSSEGGSVSAEGDAYYFSLDPPFIVNFSGKSRARFLQVSIEGLTRDAQVKENITKHFPQVRNNLVLLLSSKTYDELSTAEGKTTLRKQVLKEIQKVLEAETGKEGVEDVYFTSFVMQ